MAGMGRTLRWLVVILVVAAVGVVLRLTVLAPRPVQVEVARVERGVVEATVTNTRAGTVKARRRAKLSPEVGGRVFRIPHRKGARVHAGDLLIELDGRVQRAQLELARRSVAAARARAREACLAAELAEKELARGEALHARGISPEQQLDSLRTERDRTAAACRAARAGVEEAAARVRVAEEQLRLTRLLAPFDGVVGELSTEVGEWVTPSPPAVPVPPVIDLIDPASIYVSAPIDEVDSGRVRVGQAVRVTVDPRPGESFAGTVVKVAAYVEDRLEQNRTLEVEVELQDAAVAASLLPGTSADVEIVVDRRESTLRVPTAAVGEGGSVLLLEDGVLVERAVRTGLSNWEYTEVLEGLDEGAMVVTSRQDTQVKAGVRAVPRGGGP